MLTTVFLLSAFGKRWAANDGNVTGNVIGERVESGGPVALVDGDNDDGDRACGHWRRHDPRGWRSNRARLLRERQAHDDGPRDGADGVQLSVRQRREIGVGRLSPARAHRDLLLVLSHADTIHHRSRALPQHRYGQLRVLPAIGKFTFIFDK